MQFYRIEYFLLPDSFEAAAAMVQGCRVIRGRRTKRCLCGESKMSSIEGGIFAMFLAFGGSGRGRSWEFKSMCLSFFLVSCGGVLGAVSLLFSGVDGAGGKMQASWIRSWLACTAAILSRPKALEGDDRKLLTPNVHVLTGWLMVLCIFHLYETGCGPIQNL